MNACTKTKSKARLRLEQYLIDWYCKEHEPIEKELKKLKRENEELSIIADRESNAYSRLFNTTKKLKMRNETLETENSRLKNEVIELKMELMKMNRKQ